MHVVKTAELCRELGYTSAWISTLHRRGMPQIKRGTWDLDACRVWLEEQQDAKTSGVQALTDARVRVSRLQGDKLEMELAVQSRQLIPVADVEFALDQCAVTLRSGLESWVNDAKTTAERADRQHSADGLLASIGAEFAAQVDRGKAEESASAA